MAGSKDTVCLFFFQTVCNIQYLSLIHILMFTVETVSCLGACGLAPVLTVNDKVYPAMTPEKAVELLEELK